MEENIRNCTVFQGFRRLASGPIAESAVAARIAIEAGSEEPVLIYDDTTGEVVDIDMRPNAAAVRETRERGRPKLGVVAREVTLLPRHWDWLREQPGGASVALRKLVDNARKANAEQDRKRARRDAAYRFMSAMAGNLPQFEEASRALFSGDQARFEEMVAGWPEDVRTHVIRMAFTSPSSGS